MSLDVREEVLNVLLAELLEDRGLISVPESIRRSSASRHLPDITIADLQGIRIVIEGRISNGAGIQNSLVRDAARRVEEGISPICLAVMYPLQLRSVDSLAKAKKALSRALLKVRVISEADSGSWSDTSVDGLSEILRRSYELLINEDVVSSSVEDLNAAMETASEKIIAARSSPAKLRTLLGIPEDTSPPTTEEDD